VAAAKALAANSGADMKAEIVESKSAQKDLAKVPKEILTSYEIWARLLEEHGTSILREFKGYHDEKLHGQWLGYRSSRLNLKWRVIYRVNRSGKIEIVNVSKITPHDYRSK
jgi:addiction module RelE/StbE family toxin